jgi:methionine synthase I (cobalamin-dependent)/5,10-methylenetetrahydrofolate reductase
MPASRTSSPLDLFRTFAAEGSSKSAGTPGALTERERFRMLLRRRPLLFDGAMGTLLFSRGIPQRACLDEIVLTHPEVVSTIHREYLEAGADVIETDSFGANRFRLADFGLETMAGTINRRAAQLAREARDVSGREALVAGSIGPLWPPRPADRPHPGLARAAFREQIEGLLEGGVDLLVCETFGDLAMLMAAIEEVRRACDLPLVAQMTFGEDLQLDDGTSPARAAEALAAVGVDAIGVNCGAGPLACLEALVRTGSPTATVARSLQPNAGLPRRIDGRLVYSAEPDYFGEMVPRMIAAGATILGGCCGTGPAHTARMRAAIDMAAVESGRRGAAVAPRPDDAERPDDSEREDAAAATPRTPWRELGAQGEAPPPTGLARKLADGNFVISVEIDPPRSIRIDRTLEAARLLKEAGVDLVNVSDSATGRVRMGAMAVAFGIEQELGLECLVHLTTRDRNLMALEAELLGAHALGLRNILALTGDPPRAADLLTTKAVWDVDAIGLIEIIRRLNQGEDQVGSPIGQRAGFTIACALDPTSADPDKDWARLERKLAAGANVVMTQPLYAPAQVEAMLDRARRTFGPAGFPVPVLLGVLPLHSSRHAEFLHNEVPGITIPVEQRTAMREAGGRGAEIGLEMALDLLERTVDMVQGTYIMPSFGRYEISAELVRRLRARMAGRTSR